jgi:hypothetical protein
MPCNYLVSSLPPVVDSFRRAGRSPSGPYPPIVQIILAFSVITPFPLTDLSYKFPINSRQSFGFSGFMFN